MNKGQMGRLVLTLTVAVALSGCEFKLGDKKTIEEPGTLPGAAAGAVQTPVPGDAAAGLPAGKSADVEAPEIFQKTDKALWDGRPSLGGVWVAHASVSDPQRVVIRNPANGKTVQAALFRREFNNPGPSLQLSSDAAEALGILAGQPATVSVVALKRVEVAPPPPAPAAKPAAPAAPLPATAAAAPPAKPGAKPPAKPAAKPAAGQIEQKPLSAVTGTAAAAIEEAAQGQKGKTKPAAAKPAPAAPAAPATAPLGAPAKPFLQVGIFSTADNAKKAAAQMLKAGYGAQVKENKGDAKTLWRVLVGPVATAAELEALLAKAKSMGYADAYPVSK